jgi:Fe-S-cluster-containing hydrogenase component 2
MLEKRRIAAALPVSDPKRCIHCNQCALVCTLAVIRPQILTRFPGLAVR